MSSPSTGIALMAGSALLLAAAASTYFSSSSSASPSSREITEIDDELDGGGDGDGGGGDFITEDLVVKVFDRLYLEMQAVISQLSQQIQQLQRLGQRIPQAQLKMAFVSEFEKALIARQPVVFEEHGVDADCIEEATWEFLKEEEKYPKVKKAVERFQALFENISEESVVGRRPGVSVKAEELELLTPDQTIKAAEAYFGALTSKMKELVQDLQSQGKNMQDRSVAMEFQMRFDSVANDAGGEALKKVGTDLKTFQASIKKNADVQKVAESLMMLQMQQQRELQAMGIGA